jgi:hypothetical protein
MQKKSFPASLLCDDTECRFVVTDVSGRPVFLFQGPRALKCIILEDGTERAGTFIQRCVGSRKIGGIIYCTFVFKGLKLKSN